MRVGFVGEWGYEIHVAAEHGPALWDALMKAGEAHGIGPFGVEAQRLLRLEKGHLILGQDTDGLTTPFDVNLIIWLPPDAYKLPALSKAMLKTAPVVTKSDVTPPGVIL